VLATMNLLARIEERFERSTRQYLPLLQSGSDGAMGVSAAVRALRMLWQSLVLALAAWLAIRQEISPGAIIATSILAARALAPIDVAVSLWRQFIAARLAAARLRRSLGEAGLHQSRTLLPAPGRRLAIGAASVAPPASRIARWPACPSTRGRRRAGHHRPSGSGKTTLARAITGVGRSTHGEITLDARHSTIPGRGSRQGDRLPAQDVELFDGTIADTIARSRRIATTPSCGRRCSRTCMNDPQFPQGYDTRIGDGGCNSPRASASASAWHARSFAILSSSCSTTLLQSRRGRLCRARGLWAGWARGRIVA